MHQEKVPKYIEKEHSTRNVLYYKVCDKVDYSRQTTHVCQQRNELVVVIDLDVIQEVVQNNLRLEDVSMIRVLHLYMLNDGSHSHDRFLWLFKQPVSIFMNQAFLDMKVQFLQNVRSNG